MKTLCSKKRRILHIYLHLIPVLILITFIAWGYSAPVESSASDHFIPHYFHHGWSQQIDGTTVPLDDLQDYSPVEKGESLIFTRTLPAIKDDQVLLFYSVNKEVTCYIDGEKIQSFLIPKELESLKTPGRAWNQVDMDSSMSGKECTLIFHSPLGAYKSLCNLYLINADHVNTVRFITLWPGIISAILLLVITFSVLGSALVNNTPRRKRYYFAISLYFSIVLLWTLARLNAFDMITHRPIISYLLFELFRRMLPLSILYLVKFSTTRIWHSKIINGLTYLLWANLFLTLVLPVGFGVSLFALEPLHYGLSTLTIVALFLIWLERILRFNEMTYNEYPFLAVILLIFGAICDIISTNIYSEIHPFWGLGSAISCVLFSMTTFVILAYTTSRESSEKAKLALRCADLENSSLIKQIEAHFIFNALNTVSAYCKTDPQKADEAVLSLSSYLRSYLHLVGEAEIIPYEIELDMVQNYLILQQMRFGNQLKYVFDSEFTEFDLPPFVIHTFVENSIIHGFKRAGKSGTITISAKCVKDMIQVIVADDGVGFDINQAPKPSSVGVQNAIKRLALMRQGTITIDSTLGVGTTVTLSFPVDCYDQHNL